MLPQVEEVQEIEQPSEQPVEQPDEQQVQFSPFLFSSDKKQFFPSLVIRNFADTNAQFVWTLDRNMALSADNEATAIRLLCKALCDNGFPEDFFF